jgi:hypothetical protein
MDCTFRLEQVHGRETDVWHVLSVRAEALVPSTDAVAVSGRHRAVRPPSGPGMPQYTAANFIDDEIFGKMIRDGIKWTDRAGDAEFLRRVTIDLTGEIPTPEAVKAFLVDTSATKREKAIDALLASDAFTDRWTMWLGDLVQNVTTASNTNIGTVSRDAYYTFLHDSIRDRKPYDAIVRQMIAGSGDTRVIGETNYWLRDVQNNGPIQDTYDNLSASTGARFLGMTLQCISCHSGFAHLEPVNSSLVKKTRLDFWKNAAFFAQASAVRGTTTGGATYNVITDNTTGAYRLNTTSGNKTTRAPVDGNSVVEPAFILTGEQPAAGETRRTAYARILTANPQFARATVNYLWQDLFGMGIVEPANNFDLLRQDPATLAKGASLQPTHPNLITKLANAFATNGYDLRATLKLMVMSSSYQLSSRYTPGAWNETWTPYFARHYPRRLMAEALLDAVTRATGYPVSFTIQSMNAIVNKAMQLPDTTGNGGLFTFLNTFGRGNRDDDTRSYDASTVQALTMLNDNLVAQSIRNSVAASTVHKTLLATKDPGTIADTLYLSTLGRYPTTAERVTAVQQLGSGDLTRKTEDLQFALLNKMEFIFN